MQRSSGFCLLFVLCLQFITGCQKEGNPTESKSTSLTAPALLLPSDSAINQFPPLTLNWNKSDGAKSYTLQVSTANSFSDSYIIYNKSEITTTNIQVSGLNKLTQYYWRVRAENNYGPSAWSNVWSFTTGTSPDAPTILSPGDGVTNQDVSPTVSWNNDTAVLYYIIEVAMDVTLSRPIYTKSGIKNATYQIPGLQYSTLYYWRVKAINVYGTSEWSAIRSFTTSDFVCGTQVVYAGKVYNTLKIGTQCWFKENLNVGTMIQGNQTPYNNDQIEKYCYNNDENNCTIYGGLYQLWEALDYRTTWKTKGICPSGFRLPTKEDFEILKGTVNQDGNSLKAIGQGTENGAGNNTSGFSALLTGHRYQDGKFIYTAEYGTNYWSSTTEDNWVNGIAMRLLDNSGVISSHPALTWYGFSIRCIKD